MNNIKHGDVFIFYFMCLYYKQHYYIIMSDPVQPTNWSKDYEKGGVGSWAANLVKYITVESGLITSKNYKQELPKWKADILKELPSMDMDIDCLLQLPNGVVSVYMTAQYSELNTLTYNRSIKWYKWWKLEQFSKLLYTKPSEIPPLEVRKRNQFVTAGLGLSSFDKLTEVDFTQFIERMRLSKEPLSATSYPFNEFKLKLVIHKKGLDTETKRPNFECKTIEDTPVSEDLTNPLVDTPLTAEQKINNDAIWAVRSLRMDNHSSIPKDQLDLYDAYKIPDQLPIPPGNIVGGRHRKSRRYSRKYKKSNKRVKTAKRSRSVKSRKYRNRK